MSQQQLKYEEELRELMPESFPKYERKLIVPVGIPGCYSDDTEILTKNRSWIMFKDLTLDDEVASLKNNTMYYTKPQHIQKYQYKGKMFKIKQRSVDLVITPDHRLYVKKMWKNRFEFIKAEKCSFSSFHVLNSVEWNGKGKKYFYPPKVDGVNTKQVDKILMDDWLEFLGWYIAEGWTYLYEKKGSYSISIAQTKPRYLSEIKKCIEKLGYTSNYYKKGHFSFCNKQLATYLKPLGHAPQKHIPQEFMNLSKRQLEILLDSLIKGDGGFHKGCMMYYTTSKKLADQVQEIVIKLGYGANISSRFRKMKQILNGHPIIQRHTIYEIYITKRKFKSLRKRMVSKVPYDGMVYCCTVPEHVILVRRNGKTCWCGNSGKSTNIPWGFCNISKDYFREMLLNYKKSGLTYLTEIEGMVDKLERLCFRLLVRKGANIYVDDVNLTFARRKWFIEIAKKEGYKIHVRYHTDFEAAGEWNKGREKSVPEWLMDEMIEKIEIPKGLIDGEKDKIESKES